MKAFYCVIAASVTLASFTLPVSAQLSKTVMPDAPCYYINPAGKVIDLSAWCKNQPQLGQLGQSAVSAPPQGSKTPRVEIAGIKAEVQRNKGGGFRSLATGQITNLSEGKVSVLSITARQGANLIQIQTNLQLDPGQKAAFQGVIIEGSPSSGLIDDVQAWSDLYGSMHVDNFATCQFISNVDEQEKHCTYH